MTFAEALRTPSLETDVAVELESSAGIAAASLSGYRADWSLVSAIP
jgi:hypothetical protein